MVHRHIGGDTPGPKSSDLEEAPLPAGDVIVAGFDRSTADDELAGVVSAESDGHLTQMAVGQVGISPRMRVELVGCKPEARGFGGPNFPLLAETDVV